jgi:hypothetical protein
MGMSLSDLISKFLNQQVISSFSELIEYVDGTPNVDVAKVDNTSDILVKVDIPVKQGNEEKVKQTLEEFFDLLRGVSSSRPQNIDLDDAVYEIMKKDEVKDISKYITPVFSLVVDKDFTTSFRSLLQARSFKPKVKTGDKLVTVKILVEGVNYDDVKYVTDRVVDILSNIMSAMS